MLADQLVLYMQAGLLLQQSCYNYEGERKDKE